MITYDLLLQYQRSRIKGELARAAGERSPAGPVEKLGRLDKIELVQYYWADLYVWALKKLFKVSIYNE